MKVTKIQQQVKRPDRYSVYLDEKYSFSLSEHQLIGSGIRVGKEFVAEELEAFLQESNFGKAYERTLNYVMIRPRSAHEIEQYLKRTFMYPKPKMFTDRTGQRHLKKQSVDKVWVQAMIERIMERLRAKGYINDESFARAWVASRQLVKKTSRRKLELELKTKGVPSEIIATVLQNSEINESDNLRELIIKKRRLSRYQDQTKLTHYLLRQGFRYDAIKAILDEK